MRRKSCFQKESSRILQRVAMPGMKQGALGCLQDEEVEVNIDELSQETLWKLYAFISDGATDALPDAPNTSAREKGNATDQVTVLSQCCHEHV